MLRNIFIKLGFIFVIISGSIIFYKEVSYSISKYNADVAKGNEVIVSIDKDYATFNEIVPSYKEDIVVVSNLLNLYYDDFLAKNSSIIEKIEIVSSELNSLVESVSELSNNCKYDLNATVHDKCNNFYVNFKSMIDAYFEMINAYNNVVEQYNVYANKNGKKNVSKYDSKLSNELYNIYKEI